MYSALDNLAFINSLENNVGNTGNSGCINKGFVIAGGIVMLAGIVVLAYYNFQIRKNYNLELMSLKDKIVKQTN